MKTLNDKEPCQRCNGTGHIKAIIPLWAVPDINNCKFTEECPDCGGTGNGK